VIIPPDQVVEAPSIPVTDIPKPATKRQVWSDDEAEFDPAPKRAKKSLPANSSQRKLVDEMDVRDKNLLPGNSVPHTITALSMDELDRLEKPRHIPPIILKATSAPGPAGFQTSGHGGRPTMKDVNTLLATNTQLNKELVAVKESTQAEVDRRLKAQLKDHKAQLAAMQAQHAHALQQSIQQVREEVNSKAPSVSDFGVDTKLDSLDDDDDAALIRSLEQELIREQRARRISELRDQLDFVRSTPLTPFNPHPDGASPVFGQPNRQGLLLGQDQLRDTHIWQSRPVGENQGGSRTSPLGDSQSLSPLVNTPVPPTFPPAHPPAPPTFQQTGATPAFQPLVQPVFTPSVPPASTPASQSSHGATTVLTLAARNNAPAISTWNSKDIDAFDRYCLDNRLKHAEKTDAWLFIRQAFPVETIDQLSGLIDSHCEENRIPRCNLHTMEIDEVVRMLRHEAMKTDKSAAYNVANTLEGNLILMTSQYIPDTSAEGHAMRAAVLKILKNCPPELKADLATAALSVKRWVKHLKPNPSTDQSTHTVITHNFRHWMEHGNHNQPIACLEDVGLRALQYGIKRDQDRQTYALNFGSPGLSSLSSTSNKAAPADNSAKASRPAGPKAVATPVQAQASPAAGPSSKSHELCYVCGKFHVGDCRLGGHPDANHNKNLPWKDTAVGQAITTFRGHGSKYVGLDFTKRWDFNTKTMIPLEDQARRQFSDVLPQSKPSSYKPKPPGETSVHTIRAGTVSPQPEPPPATNLPPCCTGNKVMAVQDFLVPAILQTRLIRPTIHVLIDTGCLQTNIVSSRVAALLRQDGGRTYDTNITVTAGVGGKSYDVQGIMNLTITFETPQDTTPQRHVSLRAIVCKDITLDLIIGVVSIKHYNLLPLLAAHMDSVQCCEMCSVNNTSATPDLVAVTFSGNDLDILRHDPPIHIPSPRALPIHHVTLLDTGLPTPVQHSHYVGDMATLYHILQDQADTSHIPAFHDAEDITQTIQALHMSDILGYEDDGSADNGPNDVDISRMRPDSLNDDFAIGGPPELQADIRLLLQEYNDIFSYSVKGKAMDVPPMHFQVDDSQWYTTPNQLPSRHISVEKHLELNQMIDDLLELQVIQPSRATAWSQVHLVK
jgi:hypothetical protein